MVRDSEKKRKRLSEINGSNAEPSVPEPTGWEALEAKQNGAEPTKEVTEPAHKLGKNAKKRQRKDKETTLRLLERRERGAPTSIPEFEQLVLSSPNSSYAWIRYMSFLISLGELERASAIAKRALATIHYREETERFNMWTALLNAECNYGTEEQIESVLRSALPHVDTRKMYILAIDIFEKTDKTELLELFMTEMCRKYGEYPDVWLRVIKYKLTQGDGEGAQQTLVRSLLSIPVFDHVAYKSKVGVMEYKVGDAERGRSIFEGLLHDNPKRLDLWSVYLDQEIGQEDQQRIRSIFERATHLQLPAKKMKFLFKRYLEYETKHGDAKSVSHVKQRAMEFVERSLAGTD